MTESEVETARTLGEHGSELDALRRDVTEIKTSQIRQSAALERIELVLATDAGERKVTRYLGHVITGIAASVATALGVKFGLK